MRRLKRMGSCAHQPADRQDIARWKERRRPVLDVESFQTMPARRCCVTTACGGPTRNCEWRTSVRRHPLALGLLASFLKEQGGDVRRRDHIANWLDDPENLRHDHPSGSWSPTRQKWLAGQPVPHAIMHMVPVRRPASGDCLAYCAGSRRSRAHRRNRRSRRRRMQRAVTRLRDVRLLAPQDPATPDALDAHRWCASGFGQRMERRNRRLGAPPTADFTSTCATPPGRQDAGA